MSTARQLAGRIGRHSAIYAVGVAALLPIGLVNVAVLTRLVPPSEFGRLVLLLAVSTALSLVYNLAIRQGTLGLMFGKGGEEEGEGDEEHEGRRAELSGVSKRDVFGTGLLLTIAVGAAGTALIWVLAADLGRLLINTPPAAVRLAAVVAALTAVWRMLLTVLRMERRPRTYVTFNVALAILALVAALPFVLRDGSAAGVLAGLVIATTSLTLIALLLMRKAYRVRLRLELIPALLQRGLVFVPLVLSMYAVNQGGVVILSRSVSAADIGLYGVAATFGRAISSFATVFFMAWTPIKRTSLFVAVHKERGDGWLHSTLTTYYALGLGAVFVALSAASGLLVRIAGPEYADAAPLIPAIGAAASAHAAFLLAYRISAFPRKRLVLVTVATLVAVTFVIAALMLVEALGLYAVPVAAFGSLSLGAAAMLTFNQCGPRPVPFQYAKLARIAVILGLCVAGPVLLADQARALAGVVDLGSALAFPALILLSGAASRADLASVTRVARDVFRGQRRQRADLAMRVAELTPDQAQALEAVARPIRRRSAARVCPSLVVAALRSAAPLWPSTKHDEAIGRYLTSDLSRAERDALARALWQRGVPPAELDRLEEVLDELKRLPLDAWRARPYKAEVQLS